MSCLHEDEAARIYASLLTMKLMTHQHDGEHNLSGSPFSLLNLVNKQ